MPVRSQTYLQRREGAYYFRLAVPAELWKLIGKREIKLTLKTRDPKVAKHRAQLLAVEWSSKFDDARRTVRPELRTSLSQSEIETLAELSRVRLLAEDEQWRTYADDDALGIGNSEGFDHLQEG